MTRVRNRHRDRQRPVRQRLGASDMATNIRAECLLSAETGGNWAAGAPRNDGAGSVDDYPPKTSPDEDTQDDATMVEPGSSQTGLRWISGRYSGQDTFANRTTAIGQTAINRLDKMQRQSARLHEQWLMPLDFPWFREKSGPMLPAAVDGRIGAIDRGCVKTLCRVRGQSGQVDFGGVADEQIHRGGTADAERAVSRAA